MQRDDVLRPSPADKLGDLVLLCVAADVNPRFGLGDDLDITRGQPVENLGHRFLITGDRARRENYPVARAELHRGIFPARQPSQRRPRLALRSGAEQ